MTKPVNGWALAGRQQKALAMVAVIDRAALAKDLSPHDQAGRILLVTHEWIDQIWEDIGALALQPNGTPYKRKAISSETREMVRSVYRGRAQAPVARRAS